MNIFRRIHNFFFTFKTQRTRRTLVHTDPTAKIQIRVRLRGFGEFILSPIRKL